MGRLFKAELIKLRSLNIWWLVIAGGVLPVIITWLTLFNKDAIEWLGFTNLSLLSFNVQSLLTFSAFTSYIWAREYEENTMDLVLCYPFPRFSLVWVKLITMFLVIVLTITLYFFTTIIISRIVFGEMMPKELLWRLIKALLHSVVLHFLLIPVYLCIVMVSRHSISGLIFGIVNMCLCMAFNSTGFLQYIPQCIPYVLGDHQLGMNSLVAEHSLWVYYGIVLGICVVALVITKVLADRLKR